MAEEEEKNSEPSETYKNSRERRDFDQAFKLREYRDAETKRRVKFFIDSGNKILNQGIAQGLESIVHDLPRLAKKQDILLKDLNKPEIKDYFQRVYEQILERAEGELSERDVYNLVNKIAEYITSTKAFKENGQARELILKEGSIARAENEKDYGILHFLKRRAQKALRNETYVDRAIESFDRLYGLMKRGDYSDRMPELSRTVNEIHDLGFFNAAADILFEGKLLNPKKYESLKKTIQRSAEEKVKYAKKSLESYVLPQKMAAVVLGVIGLGSLLMNNSITGNVIGAGNPNIFGLLGGALLVISAGLLWFAKKKQVKDKTRRKPNIKKKKKKKKR